MTKLMSPREHTERELYEIERYEVSGVHMPSHVDIHGHCTHDSIIPECLEIVFKDGKLAHKSVWTCRYCGHVETRYLPLFMHDFYFWMLGEPLDNWNEFMTTIPKEVTDFIAALGEDWEEQLRVKSVEWMRRKVIPKPSNKEFYRAVKNAASWIKCKWEIRALEEADRIREEEAEEEREEQARKGQVLKDGFLEWMWDKIRSN
jgi:hypothetical protein